MERLEEFEEALQTRWADDPAGALCLKLVRHMSEQPKETLRMMTFFTIGKILGRPPLDDDVRRAITILVSSKVHVLETHLIFVDDNNREYEVDLREMEEAREQGAFVHPETGEVITDYETKMIPFFVPTEEFFRLKARRNG